MSPSQALHPTKHRPLPADAPPFYVLSMFPYPSGRLHIGHLRVYCILDVLARFHRLTGKRVVHPMGWDAFGLPAENAAVENGIDPAVWTRENIARMRATMGTMLLDLDWDREFATCDEEYYRWTQHLFLRMFRQGLAYRKRAEINWDPVDNTVLANEQVDAEGRLWRLGAVVEKRMLEQWFLGITRYADELDADLDQLTQWPEKVRRMQRHWIGKSQGADVLFPSPDGPLTVFTTRADTLYLVQFLAVSPLHQLAQTAAETDPELAAFLAANHPEDSKQGYRLPVSATNPLTNEPVPVYAAPYVLAGYGTGVVMGCPAHDERDYAFWQTNSPGIPAVASVKPAHGPAPPLPYAAKDGVMMDVAGEYAGMSAEATRAAITAKLGAASTRFRIRDWLISRQRYWGAPIPIVHCDLCGPVAVPEDQLPVTLPPPHGTPGKNNALANMPEWYNTTCPLCGGAAKRDTDTMDTFIDLLWYFFRFLDPRNETAMFSTKAAAHMPVDVYVGGVEHAILHLLYLRFVGKFLRDEGMWQGPRGEPITKLLSQGMVNGKTFSDPVTGRFLKPHEVEFLNGDQHKPVMAGTTTPPALLFEKMSKSKFNGVDPVQFIAKYGADATRAHVLFLAPVEMELDWDEAKISGCVRWLHRVVKTAHAVALPSPAPPNPAATRELHTQLHALHASITSSLQDTFLLNTVVSDLMKLTRAVAAGQADGADRETVLAAARALCVMLAPVCPSVAEEAWAAISTGTWDSVFAERWPEVAPVTQVPEWVVMVKGKRRGVFAHAGDVTPENALALVHQHTDVTATPLRVIVKNHHIILV